MWCTFQVDQVLSPHQHIIRHFGEDSFQSITCTDTDNLTIKNNQATEHTNNIKITQPKKSL